MKKIFILCTIVFSINIINAQTIKELEDRYEQSYTNIGYTHILYSSGGDNLFESLTPEDQTWGFGYNYSTCFPLTISANLTNSFFYIGTELGINLDGKKYHTNLYNPIGYLTISPGIYFRYLSINCGMGILLSEYTKTVAGNDSYTEEFEGNNEDESFSLNGSITNTSYYNYQNITNKYHFILKPSITGYIPICDEDFYITINIGYNYTPKIKELNEWSFGVGFQCIIF